ncbi:type II secretion system protein [Hydrogenobacter hydrogenophilus]|uniref:Prepilin-type N-terminal cleavage/methylation domain-containing protein n=1 Tax=Hydrogenobacter hydrogenophilus TaxID=35835 RepID=A0A285P3Q8_9AQUI|nr:prepilin-type N-terminal cleavage/methylation domain-containing protein [Hydrogenobacter hydrogenophilus]SNZ16360.1 prepilin-type N-terminal cleavage/methylation domain-containing protein [Hydrogenobacter hydrogenophilus]
MCGNSKGFTLLEVLVATVLLGVFFSVLFDLLSNARKNYYESQLLFTDMLILNNKLILNQKENLEVKKEPLKDYPQIEETTYSYGKAQIYIYTPKR